MGKSPAAAGTDHFLPDLCTGPAVLWQVLGAVLLTLVLVLARGGLPAFDWVEFALILLLVEWSILLAAALLCRLRGWLSRQTLALGAMACVGAAASIAAGVSLAGQLLLAMATSAAPAQLPWWTIVSHGLIAALLTSMLLRYFFLAHQLRRREQVALAAQVEALSARIRPHFLFNSLNSIASLIAENAAAAEQTVEDLAALFRASLTASATVPMAEERDLCERYLRIEQLRLGSRLAVVWRWDLAEATPIPALALQPLLENAVYHGIQRMPSGGQVEIEGRTVRGWVEITVTNPCASGTAIGSLGHQLATDNIRRRIKALFGPGAELSLGRDGDRFVARLRYHPMEG